jgi:hypothetical protein
MWDGHPASLAEEMDSQIKDSTCYSIRSYVVARDSKDSDSTHPVSSSMCHPASRYHVKGAEIHSDSSER